MSGSSHAGTAPPSHTRRRGAVRLAARLSLAAWLASPGLAIGTPAPWEEGVALAPQRILSGPGAPAATAGAQGGVILALPFDTVPDRAYWDIPIRGAPADATALGLQVEADDPAAIRAISVHLLDNTHWLSASAPYEGDSLQRIVLQRCDFRAETGSPQWEQASILRVSVWKDSHRPAKLSLHALTFLAPRVAILEETAAVTAASAGPNARRALRLFAKAGIDAVIIPAPIKAADLRPYSLAVLPFNPELPAATTAALEAFVTRRGGRLMVFYSADPALAALLGVRPHAYTTGPAPWSEIRFPSNSIPDLPPALPHVSQHLIPVEAVGTGQATGYWVTPDGFVDRALPAVAQTPRGIWFSHTPPLATAAAAQWLLASLAAQDSRYAAIRDAFLADLERRQGRAGRVCGEPPAGTNEFRGVWSRPLDPRQRASRMPELARLGITAILEQAGIGGFLAGAAETAANREPADRPVPDVVRAAETAHKHGLSFHAWVLAWNVEGLSAARRTALAGEQRLMQDARGQTLPWLCPSHPQNRQDLLHQIRRLAASGVDGIHLDYIRYPGRDGCFSPVTRQAFERNIGEPVPDWPQAVDRGGRLAEAYNRFRTREITTFVEDVARVVRQRERRGILSAAVYPTPESAAENGQDWPAWCRGRLLDLACPMLYTETARRYDDWLARAAAAVPAPGMLAPGIGVGAETTQLDALATAMQVSATRRRQAAGFIFFDLNPELLSQILPPLALSAAVNAAAPRTE